MIRNLTRFPNNVTSNNNNNNRREQMLGWPTLFHQAPKMFPWYRNDYTASNCTSANNGKQTSYRHAATRANMHPFRNLMLYLSTKVMFTAVFTLNFTQWSSQ